MGRVDAAAVRVRMVMKERPHLTSGSASGGGMSQEEQRAVERERKVINSRRDICNEKELTIVI